MIHGPKLVSVLPRLPLHQVERHNISRATKLQIAGAVYNWLLCFFVTFLVFTQIVGVFWTSLTIDLHLKYGRSPLDGLSAIGGTNDDPYSDRAIVCVLEGRSYVPMTVNDALALRTTKLVDATGTAVNGYRVIQRDQIAVSDEAIAAYTQMCSAAAITLDGLFERCTLLGYNLTQDNLRVVADLDSTAMYLIQNSLPVLIMPFWDNALRGRFAIPGWDGSACIFYPEGIYINPLNPTPLINAVTRTTRETKTVEWLKRPGGAWRNGWYEDLEGTKWFSDVQDSDHTTEYEIQRHKYNISSGEEVDCSDSQKCDGVFVERWGSQLSTTTREVSATSIFIANGKRYGLFLYEGRGTRTVTSKYDWENLLSNVVLSRVLFRWMVIMFALQRGYYLGTSAWCNAGLGCLANSRSFMLVPFMLLPRMRMALFAFWTAGCKFEGPQNPLSLSWYVIYPAIIEVLFFYFAVLNGVAKLFGRRMSDCLVGPMVLFFCAMHWYRDILADVDWIGSDGRISSVISADEFNNHVMLKDFFFSPDLALRVNGNVKSLFYIKLSALALPLLVTSSSCVLCVPTRRRRSATSSSMSRLSTEVERALGVRIHCGGGFGNRHQQEISKCMPETSSGSLSGSLKSSELVRFGYVIYGDGTDGSACYVLALDDWDMLTMLAPIRIITHLWHYRVLVFEVHTRDGVASIDTEPKLCHIDDPRLRQIQWWQVSARAIK